MKKDKRGGLANHLKRGSPFIRFRFADTAHPVSDLSQSLVDFPPAPISLSRVVGALGRWVGVPGSLLNVYGTDYDASAAHELGHNFGAYHASYM